MGTLIVPQLARPRCFLFIKTKSHRNCLCLAFQKHKFRWLFFLVNLNPSRQGRDLPSRLESELAEPLAEKNLIHEEDLYGRTLMVGGGSPTALRAVQHRLMSTGKIDYFNSPDHDTTRTNVAAERGVCLAPGFLNDHSGQFAWIPFDCKETFSCVLCTHKDDTRPALKAFIELLQKLYTEAIAFPM